jgi:flagellar biosynthesis GTPase FlhF
LEDAEKALELRPGYVKAHHRAAKAAILLGELGKARHHLAAAKDTAEKVKEDGEEKKEEEEKEKEEKEKEEKEKEKEENKKEKEEVDLADDLLTVESIERLKADMDTFMREENWTQALDTLKDLRFLCPCQEDLLLLRAEILAMMGTFEESNRIVNDIKVKNCTVATFII